MLTISCRLLVKIRYYSCYIVEKQNASSSCVDRMVKSVKRRQLVVIVSITIRTGGGESSVFNAHRAFVRRIHIVAIGINNSETYYEHVTNRMKATTPCAPSNNEKWKAQNIFIAFWFDAYMQLEKTYSALVIYIILPIFFFTPIKWSFYCLLW